jgi:hypothetical protein
MRRDQTFDAVIKNKSIGVEIETFKERGIDGEVQRLDESIVKRIITHLYAEDPALNSEDDNGLWTLKIFKYFDSSA